MDSGEEMARFYAQSWLLTHYISLTPGEIEHFRAYVAEFRRGADPVAEHDSHGELVYAIAELYRYGGDLGLLRTLWPHVDAAVRHLDTLRAAERGPANPSGPPRVTQGLLPASISHEGYSAKPMHAYWDDFWALRGYKDAVLLAQALGDEAAARRIAASRDEFRHDLLASIDASSASGERLSCFR